MNDIPDIVEAVCTEFLIMKSITEVSQFLSVLGISDLIKAYQGILHEAFVHSNKEFVGHDLDKFFLPVFSPAGRKRRSYSP